MGRNRSNATAAAVKGNLVAGTGVDTSGLLAVGANDTVLTADSAEATGMKWAVAAGGDNFVSLNGAGTALSSASTVTVSFSAVNTLHIRLLNATVNGSAANQRILLRINTDSGGNYNFFNLGSNATTLYNKHEVYNGNGESSVWLYTQQTAVSAGGGFIEIQGAKSSGIKPIFSLCAQNDIDITNGNTAKNAVTLGQYTGASAITSISIISSTGTAFSTGTVFVWGS